MVFLGGSVCLTALIGTSFTEIIVLSSYFFNFLQVHLSGVIVMFCLVFMLY